MKSLRGHLLVASPRLVDPNFIRAVLLMVQHDEEGALGLILNRVTDTTIGEAWTQVSNSPCARQDEPLHHGGPCEGPLMVVHTNEHVSQLEVLPGIYFSSQKDDIEWLVEQKDDPVKFFIGCAGWAPEQLEHELGTGSWLTTPAAVESIFDPEDDQWAKVTNQIARVMAHPLMNPKIIPRDPSLN